MVDTLLIDEKRRANTFSWPRGEHPHIQDNEKPSLESSDIVKLTSRLKSTPSVSIEPNVSLELTEDLLDQEQQQVETFDGYLSKAVGSSSMGERVIIHSDEESVEDVLFIDSNDEREDTNEKEIAGSVATKTEPSDNVSH